MFLAQHVLRSVIRIAGLPDNVLAGPRLGQIRAALRVHRVLDNIARERQQRQHDNGNHAHPSPRMYLRKSSSRPSQPRKNTDWMYWMYLRKSSARPSQPRKNTDWLALLATMAL